MTKMQQAVEGLFRDGTPLHHLPEARKKYAVPGASSIFVVDYKDLKNYMDFELQEIFRDRHILITGAPNEEQEFGLEALENLGSMHVNRCIQGKCVLHVFYYNLTQCSWQPKDI